MADFSMRPSGVPGLVIWGNASFGYELMSQPEGVERAVTIPHSRRLNHFRLVRDAKAASARLADLLPWNDEAALAAAIRDGDRTELQWAIAERLVDKTRAVIEEERQAEEEARRRWHDGTEARDGFDRSLREMGHLVSWQQKGARTFWGTCNRCGGSFRSSYRSVSRSYDRTYGDGVGPSKSCSGEITEVA
jgi:hypothetical protein